MIHTGVFLNKIIMALKTNEMTSENSTAQKMEYKCATKCVGLCSFQFVYTVFTKSVAPNNVICFFGV